MTDPELAYSKIEKLITRFKNMTRIQHRHMNEDATRLGFILPMFSALGWNTSNMNEVSPEEKVSRGFVDFSFKIGGIPRLFLETKRVSEDLNDPRWIKQTVDYAWTKSVTWALLSDFEGLRVFNSEWKEYNPLNAQFLEFDLDSYLSDFERLWWLSRDETAVSRLTIEAEKWGKKIKRQPVSQHLFDDLKEWRGKLYKSLRGYNPNWTPEQIDASVLKLLNRLIFIRTAEDREVEPHHLMPLIRELRDKKQMDKLSVELRQLFREFDATYNSQLFAEHIVDQLYCDRPPLEDLINGLYGKDYVLYNFNAIDADVLGTAYEQYLGHIIADAKAQAHVEEKRTKRKSQGIYYTPSFVVKYIVQQTLGKFLEENGYNPSKPPRVLDMACGSGSFLIEAFDVLDNFVAKLRHQAKGDQEDVLDYARRMEILTQCIYGVDKDPQAVEVVRLNLLLRALSQRVKLPILENIYQGDSLTGDAWDVKFSNIMQDGGFDVIIGNPPYVRIQTLDKDEINYFNQKFITATGNYDIYILFVEQAIKLLKPGGIIGYILPNKFMQVDYGVGLRKLLSERKYIKKIVDFKASQVFEGATTYTCLLFLKKKENSTIEYLRVNANGDRNSSIFNTPTSKIISTSLTEEPWFLSNKENISLLEKLSDSRSTKLLNLPVKISRGSSSGADNIYILSRINNQMYKTRDGKILELEPDILRIPVFATDFGRYQFNPIAQERIILPYVISASEYSLLKENELISEYPKTYKYLSSKMQLLEKRKYYRTWYAFSAPRNLHVHDSAQIVVPLLADKGLFTLLPEDKQNYCLMASGGFSISVTTTTVEINYLLGLLNSKALFWYLKQISNVFRGGWITCTKQYIGKLPIYVIDRKNPREISIKNSINVLVDEMLHLQKENLVAEQNFEDRRFDLKKRIEQVDTEIDQIVYELFGLTEEEISIIEGKE